jgi:glycosyltransferase involved in cell wall biosynthesis
MRVWIVESAEPIPQIDGNFRRMRCGMLAEALAAEKHSVVWWSSTFCHLLRRHRYDESRTVSVSAHCTMRLLHGPGYGGNRSLKRWVHQRAIAKTFACEARQAAPPDLIFVCLPTLELAAAAVSVARVLRVPVIVDVRDLWPDHYLTLVPRWARANLKWALFLEEKRADRLLRDATGITAVSKTYLKWGLSRAARKGNRNDAVFPIGYGRPPDAKEVELAAQRFAEQFSVEAHVPNITFVGTLCSSFDFDTVVTAARNLYQREPRVRVLIVGDGDRRSAIAAATADLPNVTLTGLLDQVGVRGALACSAVGLAPYYSDAPQSLPNKPFEYMAAGLPILSSLSGELCEMIATEGIGLQYQSGNAASLAMQIQHLVSHPEERLKIGRRARAVFEQRFSADVVYPDLIKHMVTVAGLGG